MNRKQSQLGFGVVEILIVVVVAGILGFSLWYLMSGSKTKKDPTKDGASSSTTKTNPSTTPPPTTAVDPSIAAQIGSSTTTYTNKAIGFSFAYPKSWGALAETGGAGALLYAQTPKLTQDNMQGSLTVAAVKSTGFSLQAAYKGATVKPVASGDGYVWKVSSPGAETQYKAGDSYNPQPRVVYESGNLKVYEFPLAHANATGATLAFAVGDNFVEILAPEYAPSLDAPQAQYDAGVAKYKATIEQIAKSIQLL